MTFAINLSLLIKDKANWYRDKKFALTPHHFLNLSNSPSPPHTRKHSHTHLKKKNGKTTTDNNRHYFSNLSVISYLSGLLKA